MKQSDFYKLHEIDNNGSSHFTISKQKKIDNKLLLSVRIELGNSAIPVPCISI